MKNLILIIAFIVSATTFAQKIEKELGSFNQIKAYDGLSIKLVPSDTHKAVVTGEHAKNVTFVNKNGLLKIKLDLDKSFRGVETYVTLYYTDLYLIDANEGAYVFSEQKVKTLDLDLKTQEGAEIKLDVNTERLNIRSISGGKIAVTGTTDNQDITVTTGAHYKAKELISKQAQVSVSSGGDAKVHVKNIAKATVKTGGIIRIYGNPKMVDEKKILGGSITIVD